MTNTTALVTLDDETAARIAASRRHGASIVTIAAHYGTTPDHVRALITGYLAHRGVNPLELARETGRVRRERVETVLTEIMECGEADAARLSVNKQRLAAAKALISLDNRAAKAEGTDLSPADVVPVGADAPNPDRARAVLQEVLRMHGITDAKAVDRVMLSRQYDEPIDVVPRETPAPAPVEPVMTAAACGQPWSQFVAWGFTVEQAREQGFVE